MSKTITAIVGDFYHDEKLIRSSLETAWQHSGQQHAIRIRYAQHDRLLETLADRPDAVILFRENRLNPQSSEVVRWMSKETAERIADYVEQGGSWLGWHSGLASYDDVNAYIGMLRGHFKFHPREHSIVTYVSSLSEIGIPDNTRFSFTDEHYFVECDEPNTNVFLRSSSRDGDSVAGWYHAFGKGKVCCLTPAHTEEGLLSQDFLAILGPVLRWIVK